ncbi:MULTISPECIES: hypothetical protein [unclassified Spirosoma]|uniref:hypothetical protein n=1 Tax=unclassified Spirosoma TaxID=2621999 RepID=UPI00096556F4|nr:MULTISPECIES: hypothetical protein [unclassified Spirosoma]MBN8821925.1 hypothetical protein [Spirosoma sp.]OJW80597.1 MAG: hypothetical protein BGO59_34565 [Spirosoma sp. 48-14]
MASYYSILRFVNNPLSDENIALGLVVLTSDQIPETTSEMRAIVRISEAKVDFAKKLNPGCVKLLHFSLNQLYRFFEQDLADQSDQIMQFPVRLKREFLDRLASYNNGILQFTKPAYIESSNISELFDRYFAKFVEFNINTFQREKESSSSFLKMRIEKDFYKPLRGKIDIDYTLRKRQLPSLYFNYHLEGIGVNGSIYTLKALDLNANHQIDTLQREVSEYESLIKRLDEFAAQKAIMGKPNYYLAVDPYEGKNKERHELYELVKDNPLLPFTCISSKELPDVVEQIEEKKVHKFSELL